ncbi:MAG: hypothetical protein IJU33_05115 [Bacteroidales bacterium]|nr:hypothetical protein [Bacteroidales bacterium]
MADKRFVDFRLDSTPGSGSYLVGHDSAGTEFRVPVSGLLGSIVVPEAQSIYVQYSANGSSWVTVWTSGCKFMRIKIGAGAWSNAMAIADVVNVATMVKVGNTLVGSGSDYVELEAGDNVTLTPDAANNKVTISATGGGSSAVQSDWEQDDDTADDYIKNKPTIPTQTSDLANDSGFLTQHQDISGKVDKVSGKGLSTNDYTTTEKNKLAGIAAGAEVNVQSDWNQSNSSADDYIKNKPAIPSKTSDLTNDSGFLTQHQDISGKVDKVSGKGLSTNDYTTTEKNKLAGIAAGAEVNVQSDWNQSNSSADDYIKHKPTIPTVNNRTIEFLRRGVSQGAITLNQSYDAQIEMTGDVLVVIDYIFDGNTPPPVSVVEELRYNMDTDDFEGYYEYDWHGEVIEVFDGLLVYCLADKAVYVYKSGAGLVPLSKGEALVSAGDNEGEWYAECLLPRCDSVTLVDVETLCSTGDLCLLNMLSNFTNVEGLKCSNHTLLLHNTTAQSIDITINAIWEEDSWGEGLVYSGLDSNYGFTLAAGGYAEISVVLGHVPAVIVKSDFDFYYI